MNRSDLIATLIEQTGLQPGQARAVVEAVFGGGSDAGLIARTLAAGDAVRLTGFGTFEARHRAARRAMNPKTGREVLVPEAVRPVFRAANQLKAAVQVGSEPGTAAAVKGTPAATRKPAAAREPASARPR
jgi:DNA-binding protein HU-beta